MNLRERRHYYVYYYYYSYGAGSTGAIWGYAISALCGLCLCCIPCVVFGLVSCIAICVVGGVEKNSVRVSRPNPTSDTQPDSRDNCRLQSYTYPQTVDESPVKVVNEKDSIDT